MPTPKSGAAPSVPQGGDATPDASAVRVLWRIAADTPDYAADDTTGTGAKNTGGRWNRAGTAVLYTSTSIALACLETVVHLSDGGLPLNRYLVKFDIPLSDWNAREVFDSAAHVGWDARPEGSVSLDWGTNWVKSRRSLVAEVSSVVVPEESNVLINPGHTNMLHVGVIKKRRWEFDARLFSAKPTASSRRP